ncbi:DUF1836 domain-containing protein [Oceanobacillus caeni]|uniref:Cytoplasmic protein n=1 Tax=Oceanobacillus caeni TaxID=405946 RepID=A0ABR5MNC6_9BACI|nr:MULTISPECIES: DUF1836 domain-containing protein [Bacillaceae]KKE79586.1 hypothetical protein WH51_05705 [Bacilli bacterium VT-13-104]PZD89704.1 DUF1836 domain-containing protein [Bacilli bacterium]KPH78745.1 hypothetical protein AFL42_01140 [Oceanobacillus caeni]MBU8790221.1 DUF1836 domain-containing protein [Oceanobacillus caeni]MCR1833448.1 DUF1836 domain-containing protein [Oceanobacillus caeni]
MQNIDELLEKLYLDTQLTIEEIPDIDLYMDQVIQLFENKFSQTKRNDEEKILTKTMINNYAKGKLFFPVKNKKYSKEHIMLISMIYQMKSSLSINDIKKTLSPLNKKVLAEEFSLEDVYNTYITSNEKNVEQFKNDSSDIYKEIEDKMMDDKDEEYLRKLLLVASFTHMSNLFRRAAEKIVDEIEE